MKNLKYVMIFSCSLQVGSGIVIGTTMKTDFPPVIIFAAAIAFILGTVWQASVVMQMASSTPNIASEEGRIKSVGEHTAAKEHNDTDKCALDEALRIANLFRTPESDKELWMAILSPDNHKYEFKHPLNIYLKQAIDASYKFKDEQLSNVTFDDIMGTLDPDQQASIIKRATEIYLKMPVKDIKNLKDKPSESANEEPSS
jgi:hypothetical protein